MKVRPAKGMAAVQRRDIDSGSAVDEDPDRTEAGLPFGAGHWIQKPGLNSGGCFWAVSCSYGWQLSPVVSRLWDLWSARGGFIFEVCRALIVNWGPKCTLENKGKPRSRQLGLLGVSTKQRKTH